MKTFFLALSFCLLLAGALPAKEPLLIVQPGDQELFETKPRRVLTVSLPVTNQGGEKREFIPSVRLPPGWKLITKSFPFELEAGKTVRRLLSFFIPQKARAGKYEITYLVEDRQYPSISDYCLIYVVVLPVRKLEVRCVQAPEYTVAGEKYTASFLITNKGNAVSDLEILAQSEKDFPLELDQEKLELEPGESATITVQVSTDKGIRKTVKHRLQLMVRLTDDKGITAQDESRTEVIPHITGGEEKFHKIPLILTLEGSISDKEGDAPHLQLKLFGAGSLDEGGRKHISFFFKEKDVLDPSPEKDHEYGLNFQTGNYKLHLQRQGERDNYRLGLQGENYFLSLGDDYYSLSPLTEYSKHGRGVKGELEIGDLTLGAYYQETRWAEPKKEKTAAYMRYALSENRRIGLNYFRSKEEDTIHEILSLQGRLGSFENTQVKLEYAWGTKSGGEERQDDSAYQLEVLGDWNLISYYLSRMRAGPFYPGAHSDRDLWSASVAFPLANRLRLRAHFRQEKTNLLLNPGLDSAALDTHYQLGGSYRLSNGSTFSLAYKRHRRKDLLPQPDFDYQENTWKLGVGHNLRKLTFSASLETGEEQNFLTDEQSKIQRYTLSGYFRPGSGQSHSGYLRYEDNNSFIEEKRHRIKAGFNSSFRIGERSSLSFHFQREDYQKSDTEDGNIWEAGLRHTFPNSHTISLRGRYTAHDSKERKDETVCTIGYSIPFELPVSKKKNIAILRGHLYDEETGGPLANVILRLQGATAVTDKEGKFIFPSLKPGVYYLQVDRAGIGLDRITVEKSPLEVIVQEEEETFLEIGVIRSATLSGQVMLYRFKESHHRDLLMEEGTSRGQQGSLTIGGKKELVENSGLANILVELKSDSQAEYRVTDKNGHFRFEELRPGEWILKIYDDDLPQYHYLDKHIFEFELKPGEKKQILAKILPKRRRIQIIQDGSILEEESKK